MTERRSRKHKPSHPVLEYCTQPSWKESMASLASSARHALVPRHARREAERKRALRAGSSAELQYSAPSPVLQSVADPGMHNAPEISLTATPAVVPVESKGLQTEETEIPQRETAILQKGLSVTQKAMRDLQRDKWLLEKEFQVWRVAAQSEHDSLEDKCTELKTMMEALNQHNQHLEEELDRVRHMCVRDRDQLRIDLSDLQPEHDDSISENDWTQPGCLKPQDSSSGEEQVQEGREAYQEGRIEVDEEETLYEVSEDISTNLDDTEEDVHTVAGQQEEVEEEGLQEEEEEELLHKRPDLSLLHRSMSDLALEEHSDSDDSEMDEEEELCELVQRLRNELSLYTATGSVSQQKEKLMTAAEGVRDSVSHLVTSVRTTSLA
uniref:Dystrotelin-like n=1 Tax=Sinocyclocheilus grahami TaxID=75366 RepID=A0A672M3X4_SINGR